MKLIPLAAALLALALPAAAQTCGPRDVFVAMIDAQYSEVGVGAGLSGDVVLEVFANPETGTWTMLATRADGVACVVASGEAWGPSAPIIGEAY